MNPYNSMPDATTDYYDADYPAVADDDDTSTMTERFGIASDIAYYLDRARAFAPRGRVLELCCGTGRIALPLARAGWQVTGVDVSASMLDQFEVKLAIETPEVRQRIELHMQDIGALSLPGSPHDFAFIGFNSLMLVGEFERQRRSLRRIGEHLRPGARLIVDVMNPWSLPLNGNATPSPSAPQRNPRTGRLFTRVDMASLLDAGHRQTIHGWYDEFDEGGVLQRRPYEFQWRPIFRPELELMLVEAGFALESLAGDHAGTPFDITSPKIIACARYVGPRDA